MKKTICFSLVLLAASCMTFPKNVSAQVVPEKNQQYAELAKSISQETLPMFPAKSANNATSIVADAHFSVGNSFGARFLGNLFSNEVTKINSRYSSR